MSNVHFSNILAGKEYLNPDSGFRSIWNVLLLFLTLGIGILSPLQFIQPSHHTVYPWYLSVAVSVLFAADLLLNFRTAFYKQGILIADGQLIRQKYLKGWFLIDLLSVVPSEMITGPIHWSFGGTSVDISPAIRMVRLLRLFHLKELINQWRYSDKISPGFIRLGILLLWLLLMAHWGACGWVLLGNIHASYTLVQNYIRALYWVITTFATVGYGDITPQNMVQIIYTIVIELIGVGFFGYMIGNIASLLANMDIARAKYMEKMTKLSLYLDYHHVPGTLRQKIRRYYKYIWESRRGYDESMILADLPGALQKELAVFLHADVIEKVPLFKDATDGFIKEIVMCLKPALFTPGDYIFREGEVGHNMYFISKGSVEILSESTGAVFATIPEGGYFGEIALVMDMPRTATVRALEYCDMYTLDKKSFHEVLHDFPEFAVHVREMAALRMKNRSQAIDKK